MKKKQIVRNIAVLIVGICLTTTGLMDLSINTHASGFSAGTITELAWISGDWQTAAGGKAQIEEHWTAPSAGTMIGMGRTIVAGKTVEFEYLRIEQRAEQIYYVSSPNGRCPATDFKLTRLTGQEAIFENPEHDFPKRILYRKNSDGSLTASIDGGAGTKSTSFVYQAMVR